MLLPPYAWIEISPVKPWKLILPFHRDSQRRDIKASIAVGHHNQLLPTIIKSNATSTREAFPVRLIKQNESYKMGPIVGIMTANGTKGFRGNQHNFKELIEMGIKTGVLVYVFPYESINKKEKLVKAFLLIPNQNKWVTRMMPLPDVVYNRIPYRSDEQTPLAKDSIRFLQQENIPLFNPYFFNKWTLFNWLNQSQNFPELLPETARLTKENLYRFVNKHPFLYLKPNHGKAGIGFFKISEGKSSYKLTYQTSQTNYHKQIKSFSGLWEQIIALTKGNDYVIQEGILLNTYHGRPYDIRVLVQKNGYGEWKVTGIGIRVAGEQSITTHVPRGGYIESVDKVFYYTFGFDAYKWKYTISDLAIDIATYIEAQTEHHLGEMSLDIGMDQDNRLWFFEANSKPMEFDEPEIRETSLLRLMQYFRFLSGFVPYEVVS